MAGRQDLDTVEYEHPDESEGMFGYPVQGGENVLAMMGEGEMPPVEPAPQGWLGQKMGPLPLWAWLLIGGGVAFGGYMYYQKKGSETEEPKLKRNSRRRSRDKEDDDDNDGEEDGEEKVSMRGSAWAPSRGRVAERVGKWLEANGAKNVTVYADADEAAKHVKAPSPLVTLRVPRTAKLDEAALGKVTRREGLYPVRNGDVVGLYPVEKSKRGLEWERYIDDLRDEGQKV